MSKVAIVGVEGSGKTVLMAALADLFGKPLANSPYLMPENQSAFSFMTMIPHKMKQEHQWPSATAIVSMKHLKWTIRIGQDVLMDLEMLDYPGELYRLAFGERKKEEVAPYLEQVHEFLEHLVSADILVVLLNLKDAMDIGGNARNNEAVWLTRGIFDYSKKLPNIQKRLLVFTQADRYPDELSGPGGLIAAKEKYMPMLHVLYPDLECAAVSVATDESDLPDRTFSATHGVTGLMRWLALQTDYGKSVQAQLEELSKWIDNAAAQSTGHSSPIFTKEEYEKLDSINSGMWEILEPNEMHNRRNQLRTVYKQAALRACDTCRQQAESADFYDAFRQNVDRYIHYVACLSDLEADLSSADDKAAFHAHREHCAQLKEFVLFVNRFIEIHDNWQLARKNTWQIVAQKFPGKIFNKYIEIFRSEVIERLKAIVVVVTIFIILAVVAFAANV